MAVLSESQFLADRLRRICDGDPWYGDSVFKILEGVTAKQASARPIPNAHTIWEIVTHVTCCCVVDERRLQGAFAREPEDGNWWPQPGKSESEWKADLAALKQAIVNLSHATQELSEAGYEQSLMKTAHTFREQTHEALEHIVYHSAQIAILKKTF
jgi:hypothetical protein